MTLPVLINSGSVIVSRTDSTINVSLPANCPSGDLIVITASSISLNFETTPDNWTAVDPAFISGAYVYLFYKISDGNEPAFVPFLASETINVKIIQSHCYSNADSITAITRVTGSSTSVLHADIVTSGVDHLACVVTGIGDEINAISFTGESGGDLTLVINEISALTGGLNLSLQSAPLTTAGTISGGSYTISPTNPWASLSFAIFKIPYAGPILAGSGAAVAGNGTTLDVPYPPGIQAGDMLLLTYADIRDIGPPPAGFDLLDSDFTLDQIYHYAWSRIADGSETGNITLTGLFQNAPHLSRMHRFTGAASIESVNKRLSTGGTITHPDIVTTDIERLAITMFATDQDTNATSFTGETGGDLLLQLEDLTSISVGLTLSLQSAEMPVAGTLSGGSYEQDGGAPNWSLLTFALFGISGPAAQNLEGFVAADPWIATTGSILGSNQNLSGEIASAPWSATIGAIIIPAPDQNLVGLVAADPWIAAIGAISAPGVASQNLLGVIAADPWIATIGAILNPAPSQNLSGLIAADPWIATTGGILNPPVGAQILAGVIAADPWISTIGGLLSLGPSQNLVGLIAADPWSATVGIISAIGVSQNLSGIVAADPWIATIGVIQNPTPVLQNLLGSVASSPWVATTGLLLAPGTGIVPPHELVGIWIPTNYLTGVWSS